MINRRGAPGKSKRQTQRSCILVSNIAQKCMKPKINIVCEGRPNRVGSQDNEPHHRLSDRRLPRRRRGIGRDRVLYSGVPFVIAAVIIAAALKMANTWQKFVILRAGKLLGVKGPGLFLIIPVIDHVVAVIDERIQTTAFSAEEALTKDTVPVNVDAIIFWFVHDAQKAALNITNYREAIDRVSQTLLREMIGSSMLSALLSERSVADELLRGEIRDVAIPVALQDAMSRQAQAEREKQARVILGSAEAAIAGKFVEAAMTYAGEPAALQLRAM